MIALQALIAEAVALGGGNLCASEHDWESEGGRSCPRDGTPQGCVNASQAVYRCTRCGTYDYGEAGGPGARDCARSCGTTFESLIDYDPVTYGFCAPTSHEANSLPLAQEAQPGDEQQATAAQGSGVDGADNVDSPDRAVSFNNPEVIQCKSS